MTSVKHGPLVVNVVKVRRKPALTYQSPVQSTAVSQLKNPLQSTSQSVISTPTLAPTSSPTPSPMPEHSQSGPVAHKSGQIHMANALLPLYHPFGTLALSLPDLDPTAFGLPAPVAVFDDPTRRASNRQRRPAAKIRDADVPAMAQSSLFVEATPTPEVEIREKASPRRRRGGGPGSKRKRRERDEDGDATYPAKRARYPRSSGGGSGLSGTRMLSREGCSPALSNGHSGVSPALDGGHGDVTEEKRPVERRKTRSRGAIVRRDSTASEDTASSVSQSASASNTAVPQAGSSGEPATNDGSNESKKTDTDETTIPERQES